MQEDKQKTEHREDHKRNHRVLSISDCEHCCAFVSLSRSSMEIFSKSLFTFALCHPTNKLASRLPFRFARCRRGNPYRRNR